LQQTVTRLALRLDAYTRLSSDDRAAILRISQRSVREVPARRDIVREGEAPQYVHLVLEGWACSYKSLPDGRRQTVNLFLPGDLCDLNVYILKEMDHSLGAITPVRVARFSKEDFDELTGGHPRITQALLWDELVTSAIQREWTLNVGQRTAYERISHLLVELFLRLRKVGLTRDHSCDFPLTQNDLADVTGLTSVHVNRTLQELRRNELIELRGRELKIHDLPALMSAAMFNPNYLHMDHEGAHLDAND
jgi:CRP-like cAMP-binding protein